LTISYLHADPKVIADFEDPKLPGWVATGEAFQNGAYQKDLNLPDRRLHDTIEGNYAINSGSKGDHQTGTLTSPPFTIDRDFLSFLIAGGESHNNRLEILIDGVVIAKCCGFRNYRLKPNYFDLKKWIGKDARIRLVDESSEPWGRILVDHFSLSNIKPEYTNWNQHKRKFTVSKNHLVFPIRNLTREQRTQFAESKDWLEISGSIVQIQVEEKIVREYSVLLADSAQDTDWYASLPFTAGDLLPRALMLSTKPTQYPVKHNSTKKPIAHNFTSPRRLASTMIQTVWFIIKGFGTTSGNTIP
jgi:hypothetical protein